MELPLLRWTSRARFSTLALIKHKLGRDCPSDRLPKMLGSHLLVLLAAAASASPLRARSDYQVKEHFHAPRSWSRIGRAPSEHVINLQIGLKQSRFSELERHLYEGAFAYEFTLC